MNTDKVEAYLRSVELDPAALTSEVGRRGDAAFVRIADIKEPLRWAVVASPGSRWFAVEVPGGFSLDRFEEDLDDLEVRGILDDFVRVAISYAQGGGRTARVGTLRLPAVIVSTPEGDRTLRRSVIADIKGLLRGGGGT